MSHIVSDPHVFTRIKGYDYRPGIKVIEIERNFYWQISGNLVPEDMGKKRSVHATLFVIPVNANVTALELVKRKGTRGYVLVNASPKDAWLSTTNELKPSSMTRHSNLF